MFEVFYYHEKLGKWIKACDARTEQEAQEQVNLLQRLWKQPSRYTKKT